MASVSKRFVKWLKARPRRLTAWLLLAGFFLFAPYVPIIPNCHQHYDSLWDFPSKLNDRYREKVIYGLGMFNIRHVSFGGRVFITPLGRLEDHDFVYKAIYSPVRHIGEDIAEIYPDSNIAKILAREETLKFTRYRKFNQSYCDLMEAIVAPDAVFPDEN